jgi:hypothetical protein
MTDKESCDFCHNCYEAKTDFIKFAQAMKTAVGCWQDANCREHQTPCKPTLKTFAEKIVLLQNRIGELELAILSHREKKESPDETDKILWDQLNVKK